MNMLRLCTNQSCKLFGVPTTKEEWDECKGSCPGCGRRSCDLISEEDWEKKNKSKTFSEQDKAAPSRIKPVSPVRRPRPRITFAQVGAVLAVFTVAVIIGSIVFATGKHKANIAATQTIEAVMTQIALANPTATATSTPIPTDIPATATPVPTEVPATISELTSALESVIKTGNPIVFTEAYLITTILFLVIIFCCFRERVHAGSGFQAWIAIVGGVIVTWVGSWTWLRTITSSSATSVPLVVFVTCTVVVGIVSFIGVDPETRSIVRRYDGSALALYLTIIWLGGGVFQSDIGFVQDIFKIPAGSSLVSLGQLFQAFSYGQGQSVMFSTFVYGGLLLTILIYGYEIIKPGETRREYHPSGLLLFIVGSAAFWALFKWGSLVPGDIGKLLSTPLGDVVVWILVNVFFASLSAKRSPHAENWGALRITLFKRWLLIIASPEDQLAIQSIGIIAVLMISGTVQSILHSLSLG